MAKKHLVSAFDMGEILKALEIDARPRGDEWSAHCPMHFERVGKMDRKPSWSVNEITGQHHCFSCGYSGSVIGLVMDMTELGSWDASRWLRDQGFQTLDVVVREEAAKTGGLDEAEDFGINWVPSLEDNWYLLDRPPKEERKKRDINKSACERFDIRWEDDGWAIPIKSWRGVFMGYQWKRGPRVDNRPDDVKKSTTLFGIDVFTPGDTVVLMESPLDVVRLGRVGVEGFGGLAAYGVFVSNDQLDLVRTFTDRLVIALDNDVQGRLESRKLYERLRHTMPTVRFLDYRQCKKVNGRRPKDLGEMSREEMRLALTNAKLGPEAIASHLMPMELPDEEKKKSVRRSARRNGHPRRRNAAQDTRHTAEGRAAARGQGKDPARNKKRRR
jgi:DNA primase